MKVEITAIHKETVTVDIGDLPIAMIEAILKKNNGTFDGNWSLGALRSDWSVESVEVKAEVKHGWLAIDPGITTGWALLDEGGDILGTSVWGTAELKASLDAVIRTAHLAGMTLTVVIERMPPGRLGLLEQKLSAVRRDIERIVRDTYELDTVEVLPGTWKPSRVARTTKVPPSWQGTPLMIHQKDAVRMGRYAQEVSRGR